MDSIVRAWLMPEKEENMKTRTYVVIVVMVMALGGILSTAHAQYGDGFVWDPQADWIERPASDEGTTNGNPAVDAVGNPTWHYKYFDGVPADSDLAGSTPWYNHPTTTSMIWDVNASYGSRWAGGLDVMPHIAEGWMNHLMGTGEGGSTYDQVPVLVWANPSATPIEVSLTSKTDAFNVWWWGNSQAGYAAPVDVDVAIVHYDASEDAVTPLYTHTIAKPTETNALESAPLPAMAIDSLHVGPGDEILFTVRATEETSPPSLYQFARFDHGALIEIVPEPTSLALLGLGALAVFRKRRRT